ncbi:actin-domain-containing protein [Macroventuria anomochaeta]|uniref:Actin-domain-containing protein n=1 Tax=Macroventuria anomochaeta TaxID=301207 RepID=A0ACB6SDY5_9PLEO|nr:actin-domain-containing protein [Macroventuria anomochaeta]KAF2632366.1 actin-domain-containing protein [Macroventuria anomochaeta]
MPPKGSRKSAPAITKTLVLDNGAYTLKAGLVPTTSTTPPTHADCSVIPNCIARSTRDKRTYIASELDSCKDFGELAFRRPVEKGFIVNWEAEKAIWEHEFMGAGEGLRCDPKETNLLLTEKPNCPKELQKNCDEIVFEQFEFAAYYRCVGPTMAAYNSLDATSLSAVPQECLLLIDTSYSDTTILPLYNGKVLQSAVRRLTVGGKLLTNYMKELSSLRHYNMMEETYLLNEIKEAVSYVTPSPQQYAKDLERTWKGRLGDKRELDSSVVVDYVLPDYENAIHGHARPHDPAKSRMRRGMQPVQGPREDLLPLGNERFAVPELLFNPSDIGIQESGIPGAVMESLSVLPEALRMGFMANVVVVGGNSLIEGFMERLEAELRMLVPSDHLLNISRAEDPPAGAAEGGADFVNDVHLNTAAPMRRIPRPSRAIDASSAFQSSVRQRTASPCTHLRAFSTTPSAAFLLPAGKQDKKKHQQFVRRWQKRLLGESEPIGAHVDPYDPTSPVRIAPEDQGEEIEVLEEDANASFPRYQKAEHGRKLKHVGGEEWLAKTEEGDMAREFEKLTLRTYTPLTLEMADQIEEWTGTPYTLRDENLLMAQTVHQVTGRPYTEFNFGVNKRTTDPVKLRKAFAQAVAEVYTFKQAGLDLDLSKLPNRGVYKRPSWAKNIKLYNTSSGELALAFPEYRSAEQFINLIQSTPEWDAFEPELLEDDELLVEDVVAPVVPEAPAAVPVMDPATPEYRRAAVVKQDPEKTFDFMSNRPVPRAKPVETPVDAAGTPVVEEDVQVEEAVSVPPTHTPSSPAPSRHAGLETKAQSLTDAITQLRKEARLNSENTASQVNEVMWRHVPLTDNDVKFALFKRLLQLTGTRIPDPLLSSSTTLGDLYGHLRDAAKPAPTSLFSALHTEGQYLREKAKTQITAEDSSRQQRANLGDLLTLGNVELRKSKPTLTEKRTKTGMEKVVQYALWERGLDTKGKRGKRKQEDVPVGTPLSRRSAKFLVGKTSQNLA